MTDLELRIKEAAQKYYTDGSSDLSDEQFDDLIKELRDTNPDSELLKTGWGYDVLVDNTPGQKIKHKYGKAGSLDKCHNWKELGPAFQNKLVDLSLKLDGLSVVLYFDHGSLSQALTRGDGEIGIDITDKIRQIFPFWTSGEDFTGAVRGEILMSYESFDKWSSIHSDAKNPRNSAAGIINSKDTSKDDLAYLSLIVYSIVGDEDIKDAWNNSYSVKTIRQRLKSMFGPDRVVPYCSDVILTESNLNASMDKFKDEYYGTYPADGVVITYESLKNSIEKFPEVVYTAKAYKFPSEVKSSNVTGVDWDLSKTRYLIPRVHFEPIQLAGTTVEYCTGYNAKYIKDMGIGPGSVVSVTKCGEIIPNIVTVDKSTSATLPEVCPSCGEKFIWNGVHLQCPNPYCGSAVMHDTLIWMSNISPMDGLGNTLKSKYLQMLVEGKEISDVSIESVMDSKLHLPEDTSSVQQNTFAKMWNDLHSCKVSAVKAILALNIPRIGGITAIKLADRMDLLWEVYQAACEKHPVPLSAAAILSGTIGRANYDSLESYMEKVTRLKYLVDRIENPNKHRSSKGKVAITGKLSVKRSQFEEELRECGYDPGDISKETKYLITDDPDSGSSKTLFAKKNNITMVSEEQFRDLYMKQEVHVRNETF